MINHILGPSFWAVEGTERPRERVVEGRVADRGRKMGQKIMLGAVSPMMFGVVQVLGEVQMEG